MPHHPPQSLERFDRWPHAYSCAHADQYADLKPGNSAKKRRRAAIKTRAIWVIVTYLDTWYVGNGTASG
jgi:hypothetical protein